MQNVIRLVAAGLCALLALSACAGGPSDEEVLADYEQAYELALSGDCATADPLFDAVRKSESDLEIARSYGDIAITSLANTGSRACDNLDSAASQMQSDPAAALASLARALPFFRDSSQIATIDDQIASLWNANPVTTLAARDTCSEWRSLGEHLPNPTNDGPAFLMACGDQTAERNPGSIEVRSFYRGVIQEYGDGQYRDAAVAALALQTRLYVADEPDDFLFFEQPAGIADSGIVIGGDNSVLTIANGSSDPINLVLSGPIDVVETVDTCEDCGEQTQCSGNEPSVDIELPAGTYQIVLESDSAENAVALATGFADINPGVKPFAGQWDLEAGVLYPLCFFIETSG